MLQSNRLAICAIGKIKKLWIRDGINQYKKRMPELIINELKTFNLNNLRSVSYTHLTLPTINWV